VAVLYGLFGVLMCVYAVFLFGLTYGYRSRGDLHLALVHAVVVLGVGAVALAGAAVSDFRRASLFIVGVLLIGDAASRFVIARRHAG
jgi:hypothetical protein